jgi:hypothetical protein
MKFGGGGGGGGEEGKFYECPSTSIGRPNFNLI